MKYWTLAARHLLVHRGRAVMLLLGYALGVAVMIVLLSIGTAMVDQSRDVSLVGGGELTALPQGIDLEALRNGGLTGMFFGISGARFVSREMLGGPRHGAMVTAVSPMLEQKAVMLHFRDSTWSVRAGGEVPSAARAAGVGLVIRSGAWFDHQSDSAWIHPAPQVVYDEIDHFHRPPAGDSAWAEWHYFNLVVSEREWWYITLLVGGDRRGDRPGGEVLVTHRRTDGGYERFRAAIPRGAVQFDTARADLVLDRSRVTQRDGSYHVAGLAGTATFDFTLRPRPHEYFPAIELGADRDASGYAVPALRATASGRLCSGRACRTVRNVPAYHDHNWGSWRSVTWEWGSGRGITHGLLYGGMISPNRLARDVPFLFALADSLGIEQVYRFDAVERLGGHPMAGMPDVVVPDSLRITAARFDDTLHVLIQVVDAAASPSSAAGPGRVFVQLRGRWRIRGSAAGVAVADSGTGFFETWFTRSERRP